VICPDRHMGGRCRYSCFLVYRGSTSFIAADFDSIRYARIGSDAIPIRKSSVL